MNLGNNDELYQEVLLQHSRRPKNYGPLEGATHQAEGLNPMCGDEVTLQLRMRGDRIEKIGFGGHACAICTASASIMTLEAAELSAGEARDLAGRFRIFLKEGQASGVPDRLAVLGGVHRFPARVKCAALPWETLVAALGLPIEEGKSRPSS